MQAAEHHVEVCDTAIAEALAAAKIRIKDVSIISFSQGPGIGHCLRVGAAAARTLAMLHSKPLVGVNHCISHLEIGKLLTAAKDPVLLYVSGANTQVIAFDAGKYRIFGETLDIGVGRIPAKTISDAKIVVDKLIEYDLGKSRFGEWHKNILFVADDGDFNSSRHGLPHSIFNAKDYTGP